MARIYIHLDTFSYYEELNFNVNSMPRALICFFILFCIFSQTSPAALPTKRATIDSLHKAAIIHRRHAEADSIRQHVVPIVFSLGYADSLLLQIEHLHTTLNNITNEAKYGFKTKQVRLDLVQMQAAIQIINESLGRDSMIMNLNNLQMFRGLLSDMAVKLESWRGLLYNDNKDLSRMSAEMNAFVQDSFTQKVAADTAFANLHLEEMIILNDRWNEAQRITNNNLKRLSALQASVSTSYFDVTELQNKINNELTSSFKRTLAQEYNYIWKTQNPYTFNEVISYTEESFMERMSSLKYYLTLNTSAWFSILIIGIIFFIWVFRNFRKIEKCTTAENVNDLKFTYILPIPILSTLIFMLNIAPFYGFDQPAIYVEILHLLILVPLTIIFMRLWPRELFFYWCILVALCVLTSIMNAIITPGWPLRFFLLGLNVASVLLGLSFISRYRKTPLLGHVVTAVAILYVVMNAFAVFSNVFGRLTLTKVLTSAAIIGFTQIIGLFILVPILTEAFYIQMKSRRISSSMPLKFNYESIESGLYQLLAIGAVFCWSVTLTTNLEIYNTILTYLDKLLNTPRIVGSTSFSIGNILTFVLILYIVSVLQKYIGYFFGETEEDFVGDLDKKESRLVIFRLIIIMVGFFLAVVASGLPVDKVTVVLGALGVGIGLGLQNIVYNLMSGVILIFEKPMQIGDYIEVADKKGRVQNIGIRASKLVTSDGSEVIVPNGDILSSHMVNWTRSNNNRRAQLVIVIEPSSELETAKSTILDTLKANHFVIQERPVEILLDNFTEKSVELTINVWINSIYKEHEFKSEMLSAIYMRLAEKNIKIV
jgi:potassium efflux system protein